jgi:formylglycine-generating enzyme required for sulfatase activity
MFAVRASRIVLGIAIASGAAGTVGCGLRTAATSDLWKEVPPSTADAGAAIGSDKATPDGGVDLPPGCVVEPASVAEMKTVAVPAGQFAMGCYETTDDECRSDEKPQHAVTLGDFAIDETEVTQAQYALCVQAGKCPRPYCTWDACTSPDLPITCVDSLRAKSYCSFVGKRLPTEAEWEKAARSTDGRKFPWGNEPADCSRTNLLGCGGVRPVGSLPAGASPYGALDMAGNVVEWVADVYDEAYYATSPETDPRGPAANAQGTSKYGGRGGGWRSEPVWQRTSSRDLYEVDYVKDSLGFRCAL